MSGANKFDCYTVVIAEVVIQPGTLDDWKDKLKPYYGHAFPIPQVHRDTIKRKVERLVEIGVLKSMVLKSSISKV